MQINPRLSLTLFAGILAGGASLYLYFNNIRKKRQILDNQTQVGSSEQELPSCVVVDPFSTGALLAYDIQLSGFRLVIAYSAPMEDLDNLMHMVPGDVKLEISDIIPFDPVIENMVTNIRSCCKKLVAIIPGTETGVELADILSERMGLLTNGTRLSYARRNKYLMGETVRKAGLRSVRQSIVKSWEEVEDFVRDLNPHPFQVILKPLDSAGGEDVALCKSIDELRIHFENIYGKVNGLGYTNIAALVQEYLEGQEYVVDTVSLHGEHKVVHVMAYDRRQLNGASFVMAGDIVLTSEDDPNVKNIVEYQKRVITALGIRNGPTHGEVKLCRGEPVLVEVGSRCHGMEGIWRPVTRAVYGFDQIGCTVVAYLFPERFSEIPSQVHEYNLFSLLLLLIRIFSL